MKKGIITQKDLSGLEKRQLTTRNIAEELLDIFKKHIGVENEITKEKLFKKLFRKDMDDDLTDWLRWEFVKKAMHYLRQKSTCFIGSRSYMHKGQRTWSFFVLSTMSDAEFYNSNLQKNIRAMRKMQEKAILSVEQGWYKQGWELPHSKKHPMLEE